MAKYDTSNEKSKKRKTHNSSELEVLSQHGFTNSQINSFIMKSEFRVNDDVSIWIHILNAKELQIRIIFWQSRELIKAIDPTFGELSTKLKTRRMDNLLNNLNRIRDPNDKWPAEFWEHLKCENFAFKNNICHGFYCQIELRRLLLNRILILY